jgi:diguanylate cyclase (GGDEF)-like protein/PAS domain S-box-containing protein
MNNPISNDQQALAQTLLHQLPEIVIQTDARWMVTYVNPAWERLTGCKEQDIIGQCLLEYIHKDDHSTFRVGVPICRFRFFNQNYRWVRLALQANCDNHGVVLSRCGILSEMAANSEKSIIEVRQRFLRLLETIDGVVWEAERGVGNTFLSAQVERLFGYTVNEWRADSNFWRLHLHPDDSERAIDIDQAAYDAERSYEYDMHYRLLAKNGQAIWVHDLCRVIVEPGQPTRMIGLMIDISRQKQVELQLIESENRFALATRGSNDGIWDWQLTNDVLHVSNRFLNIVGLTSTQHAHTDGWKFLEPLIEPDDRERVKTAFRRHVEQAAPGFSVDFRARHAGGSLLWVNWRGLAHIENGRAVRIAGSLTDLAERGSSYDPLTNLPGRPLFRYRLEHAIALHADSVWAEQNQQLDADKTPFAVLLLDLNGFKAVNDSLGHHAGDQLLQQLARRLEASVRRADFIARMSGDEFVVLLESVDPAHAYERAKVISEVLAKPYQLGNDSVTCSASIGVISSRTNLTMADDYLRAADMAMYRAKSQNLGVSIYEDIVLSIDQPQLKTSRV